MSENNEFQRSVEVGSMSAMMSLFGRLDENIKLIETETNVRIIARQAEVIIIGEKDNVNVAASVISDLIEMIETGQVLDLAKVRYSILIKMEDIKLKATSAGKGIVCITHSGKQIRCKTLGQKKYVNAIRENDIVFGIGPAGTGKTYLAMAMAVEAFKKKEVSRIIMTRPAVEAGEKLGFLPGDLQTKVDPYLRPLYDSLFDLMGLETYQRLMEKGSIEVAPLAYMRGRTLEDSFIILDEAQNTTSEQMKMLLTRIGIGSKAIINGDISQIDLPYGKKSGLLDAEEVLKNVEGIAITRLTYKDVVRHELVMKIIRAYESRDKKANKKK